MRFVDLSMPLDDVIPVDPPFLRPKIEYKDHIGGLKDMYAMYGILPEQLPDGQGLAAETVTITTHAGTHVDAPWHYHPTMNGGEKAWTIDEVPLDWFFRPGVKLDLRHLPSGHLVTAADLEEALAKIGHDLLSNMGWLLGELVAYASRNTRVVAGDVLGSGTAGNGGCLGELWGRNGGRTPPPLAEGDTVTLRVERIGELHGTVGPAVEVPEIPAARVRSRERARR